MRTVILRNEGSVVAIRRVRILRKLRMTCTSDRTRNLRDAVLSFAPARGTRGPESPWHRALVEMRLQVDSDKVLSMHQVACDSRTSASAELVETARALQPIVVGFQDETERERCIPQPLIQQIRAAGFYSMVVPRELGGLEVNLVTFLRVAELMAEGDG